jgi:hypothetical protein
VFDEVRGLSLHGSHTQPSLLSHPCYLSPSQILDEGSHLRPLHETRDSKEGITDIKYAPNNRFMATATADTWVDIYK